MEKRFISVSLCNSDLRFGYSGLRDDHPEKHSENSRDIFPEWASVNRKRSSQKLEKRGGFKMKKLAIIGILTSAYFIFVTLGMMFGNDPSELDAKSVMAGSTYFLAFSIFVLVSLSIKKEEGTN